MSKRKKISQRAAMRMRRQLNLLCDSDVRCGDPIATFDPLGNEARLATNTANTCGHAVLVYVNADKSLTLYAFKP